MGRASVLARIIWGWHGITYTPATFPGEHRSRWLKTTLDATRALIWLVIGDVAVQSAYRTPAEIQAATSLQPTKCELLGITQLPPDFFMENSGSSSLSNSVNGSINRR